jgi:hypothetical protein
MNLSFLYVSASVLDEERGKDTLLPRYLGDE